METKRDIREDAERAFEGNKSMERRVLGRALNDETSANTNE